LVFPNVFRRGRHEKETHMTSQNIDDMVERTDGNLIASTKVEGTAVYRPDGTRIGTIKHIMLDKKSGQATYAVMNFGGFLGLGEEAYPIKWSELRYSNTYDGYECALSDADLKATEGGSASYYEEPNAPPYWPSQSGSQMGGNTMGGSNVGGSSAGGSTFGGSTSGSGSMGASSPADTSGMGTPSTTPSSSTPPYPGTTTQGRGDTTAL
jgi:sporulation protein YlmC with PRC-barrel domain